MFPSCSGLTTGGCEQCYAFCKRAAFHPERFASIAGRIDMRLDRRKGYVFAAAFASKMPEESGPTSELVSRWPVAPGTYTIGSAKSPVAVAMLGKAKADIPSDLYCMKGTIRSANAGVERLIINVVTNPRIRFLIVCGQEDGHRPGEALLTLAKNGVDDEMKIVGGRDRLACLPDIPNETVERFLSQIEVIDLVHPKESEGIIDWRDSVFEFDQPRIDELLEAIRGCNRRDPGPFVAPPLTIDAPGLTQRGRDIGMMLNEQVNRITGVMLRMPSEALSTSASEIVVSESERILLDSVDGSVFEVPSIPLYFLMKAYLTGQ